MSISQYSNDRMLKNDYSPDVDLPSYTACLTVFDFPSSSWRLPFEFVSEFVRLPEDKRFPWNGGRSGMSFSTSSRLRLESLLVWSVSLPERLKRSTLWLLPDRRLRRDDTVIWALLLKAGTNIVQLQIIPRFISTMLDNFSSCGRWLTKEQTYVNGVIFEPTQSWSPLLKLMTTIARRTTLMIHALLIELAVVFVVPITILTLGPRGK